MNKIVYSFDYLTRAYRAPVELDDGDLSPLDSKPGAPVYLIPGNCLEAVPPTPPSGQYVAEDFGRWVLRDIPKEPEPEPKPEPTLEQLRTKLKEAATAYRWAVETGGITLPGGVRVLTSKADQNRITSVIVNAQVAGIESVDFKAESGWVSLSIAQIVGIASAIGRHVQACFSAERVHHEAIAQLDAVAVETYDIAAGWPASNLDPKEGA